MKKILLNSLCILSGLGVAYVFPSDAFAGCSGGGSCSADNDDGTETTEDQCENRINCKPTGPAGCQCFAASNASGPYCDIESYGNTGCGCTPSLCTFS